MALFIQSHPPLLSYQSLIWNQPRCAIQQGYEAERVNSRHQISEESLGLLKERIHYGLIITLGCLLYDRFTGDWSEYLW